jgi:hypothetical protein
MVAARQEHTATLLDAPGTQAHGKVLVVGGRADTNSMTHGSAELFDPVEKTWTTTGSLPGPRRLHTAVQLKSSSNSATSGKVLIAGGLIPHSTDGMGFLYDTAASPCPKEELIVGSEFLENQGLERDRRRSGAPRGDTLGRTTRDARNAAWSLPRSTARTCS